MQTFLPYPPEIDKETGFYSFKNSAEVLDNRRLNKQSVEAYQILQILCGKTAKWKNHPAVLMWKGFEWCLFDYICAICIECQNRGFKNTIYDKIDNLKIPGDNRDALRVKLPPWMGNNQIHASHRSRLLFKGRVDAAIETLRVDVGIRKPYKWLSENLYPKPNVFTITDLTRLEANIYSMAALSTMRYNHYRSRGFNWTEYDNDNLPYVWPVTIAQIREEQKKLVATT